jgi:hypothetical protein
MQTYSLEQIGPPPKQMTAARIFSGSAKLSIKLPLSRYLFGILQCGTCGPSSCSGEVGRHLRPVILLG